MPHRHKPGQVRPGDPLTEREHEILALLATGNALPDIAAQLGIALGTAENHANTVYTKIGANRKRNPLSRRELEILALLAAGNSTPGTRDVFDVSLSAIEKSGDVYTAARRVRVAARH